MGFKVQKKLCETCIYRKDNPLDLGKLEDEIADGHGGFVTHRECHHSDDENPACCRGFWNKHKDNFPMGQVAQRLNMVEEVDVDCYSEEES